MAMTRKSELLRFLAISSLLVAITVGQIQADDHEDRQQPAESACSSSNCDPVGLREKWHQWWHGDPRQGRYGYATRFGTFDTNCDGIVSADEASANAEQVLASMDVNEDDQISFDEFMAARMGNREAFFEKRQAARYATNEFLFDKMDADEDGVISKIEFFEAARQHFSEADANADGKVVPFEFRLQRGIF